MQVTNTALHKQSAVIYQKCHIPHGAAGRRTAVQRAEGSGAFTEDDGPGVC